MTNLEQFIRSNREEFDHKEPRQKLWARIETDLDGNKADFGWIWKAAVVVLMAVCSYLMWERSERQNLDTEVASELNVDPEFVETELYYTQLISEKRMILEAYNLEDQEIKTAFKNDLASLDTVYQELKLEFVETSNETVLEAMIDNLQLRMELLNQQLMILEKIENDIHNETNKEYL